MKFLIALMLLCLPALGAETALTVTTLSETSAAIPYEDMDTANGNSAANLNGDVFFLFYNASGSDSATVTITAQNTSKSVPGWGTLTKSDNSVSLSNGDRKMVGPFRSTAWNDSSGNIILAVSGDASADVDVAALRAPAE